MHRIALAESQFLSKLDQYLGAVPTIVWGALIVLFFTSASWGLHSWWTKGINDETAIFADNNSAYGVSRGAIVIAQFIGMGSTFTAMVADPAKTGAENLVFAGLVTTALLFFAKWLVDPIILWRVNNLDEMLKGNSSVGRAEAGIYLGFGLVANGLLDGGAPSWWLAIGASFAFGFAAVVIVVAGTLLGSLAVNGRKNIKDGMVSAGTLVGAYALSISLILRPALSGDFVDWRPGFASFSAVAVIGLGLLVIFWLPVKVLMVISGASKSSKTMVVKDMHVGASIMAAALVSLAWLIGQALSTL